MQRLTNWRTLSRLSKQVLNTHTQKKDEGYLSSSKSQLQGAEKDMDEIKTAMGLQKNKKIEYLENQSGRNYSRVSGIQESAGGLAKWLNRKSEIKDILNFKV